MAKVVPRLMRNWLLFPLLDLNQINSRQEAIEYILSALPLMSQSLALMVPTI